MFFELILGAWKVHGNHLVDLVVNIGHGFNKRLRGNEYILWWFWYQIVVGSGRLSPKNSRGALKLSWTLTDFKENVLRSCLLHKYSNSMSSLIKRIADSLILESEIVFTL